jgi:hypothetical protein
LAAAAIVLSTHLSALLVWPSGAIAQGTTAKPPVERGQEYYEQSRFDDAIGLLRDLVDQGAIVGEELQRAREILARSYVKKGYPAQAKDMFKGILRLNPAYRPDPIRVPPDETAVFDQALREYETELATPARRDTVTAPPPTRTQPPAATTRPTPPPTTPAMTPVKEEGGKKGLASQWWVWVLGAAVVGGVAAAAGGGGGGGGGETPPLPGPPPPPVLIGSTGGSR